ncbi:MAG: DUF4878 domain-containing protein [Firmicutes bacterium]|nr:DUF4878 domain-containing protein [Bacillota bacterium]MBQ9604671.1 DUF4878 domain-containing protein [Bacillota bacterium]
MKLSLYLKRFSFIFLLLCAVLCLNGCSQKSAALTSENAQALVENFLEDFKSGDYEGMYKLTHDDYPYFEGIYLPDSESNKLMFVKLSEHMQYEIKSVQLLDNEAVVNVHITNVNADTALTNLTSTYLDACEKDTENNLDKDELLLETTKFCFDDASAGTYEKDTVFNLVEKDGKWVIESNIMIYDDITGGYMTYYYKNMVLADMIEETQEKQTK